MLYQNHSRMFLRKVRILSWLRSVRILTLPRAIQELFLLKVISKSKLGCKDQESIQSSTTPDPGYQWESDKLTADTTNESQEASHPPPPQQATTKHTQTDAHKDTANTRQNKNKKDPQKKHRPGTASKIFHWRAQTGPTAPTSPPTQTRINIDR